MARYHQLQRDLPLRDAGLLEVASDDLGATRLLDNFAGEGRETARGKVWTLRFDDSEPFLRLVNHLQRWMTNDQREQVRCRISYEDEHGDSIAENRVPAAAMPADDANDGWVPIGFLFAGLGRDSVADLIVNRRFTSHAQPIVKASGDAVGYEFLLRPLPEQAPFRPAALFEAAREAGLHAYLDREARHSAIRLAANHVPNGFKKFVNFLPSSIYRPAACLAQTFRTIREHGLSPADFVFEVVETERLDDPKRLTAIFDVYRKEGMKLAMDDVGEKYATLDMMDRLQPDYVKLDRKWISGCHADARKMRHISQTLERAARFRGVVLAEGVESPEEWSWLARAGVPLLQGYLFGRPSPVPMPVAVSV